MVCTMVGSAAVVVAMLIFDDEFYLLPGLNYNLGFYPVELMDKVMVVAGIFPSPPRYVRIYYFC